MFATLMFFWVALNGSFAVDILLIGGTASALIVFLLKDTLSFFTEFKATPAAFIAGFLYYGYFLKELVKANFRLAAIVLNPKLPIRPGIIKVRTRLKSRVGRLMLANSITLTPGTLTLELCDEWIYVHCVNLESEDMEQATANIVEGFERYLMVVYG